MNPIIIGTFGHPGSGKSYFSERLARDLHLAHLRSDEIRKQIFPHPTFKQEEHDVVFGLMDFLSEKFLSSGVGVIYDTNLIKKKHRDRLRQIADKTSSRFALLHVETPLEISVERAKSRSFHPIDRNVVESIHAESEYPHDESPIVVDGTKSYEEQKEGIMEILGL